MVAEERGEKGKRKWRTTGVFHAQSQARAADDIMNTMDEMNGFRMDKSFLEVVDLDAPEDQPAYWRTRPPIERMRCLEMLRRVAFGYDRATSRLQKFFEVVEREKR